MVIRPIYAALPFEQQAVQTTPRVANGVAQAEHYAKHCRRQCADLRKALVFEATPPGYRPGVFYAVENRTNSEECWNEVPKGSAGHEHCGDLDHHPGHPLCRGHWFASHTVSGTAARSVNTSGCRGRTLAS